MSEGPKVSDELRDFIIRKTLTEKEHPEPVQTPGEVHQTPQKSPAEPNSPLDMLETALRNREQDIQEQNNSEEQVLEELRESAMKEEDVGLIGEMLGKMMR